VINRKQPIPLFIGVISFLKFKATKTLRVLSSNASNRQFTSSTYVQLCADVNECSPDKQNPCQNGGTCTNTIGGFKCKCPTQWMGDLCDEGSFFLTSFLHQKKIDIFLMFAWNWNDRSEIRDQKLLRLYFLFSCCRLEVLRFFS